MSQFKQYQDCVMAEDKPLGRTTYGEHEIRTGDARPIRQAGRRVAPFRREEVKQQIQQMLTDDVIRPSCSPWASPIVLVQKKDGSTRFCVDYRKLNAVTETDAYPLPRVDESIEAMAGAKYFSVLDLKSGYWQLPVKPEDRAKTAFVCLEGLFQFNVMPFGLVSTPASFQRLMDTVLQGLLGDFCCVYLDDTIVFSTSWAQHLQHIEDVLKRFRQAGLQINPKKCQWGLKRVKLSLIHI